MIEVTGQIEVMQEILFKLWRDWPDHLGLVPKNLTAYIHGNWIAYKQWYTETGMAEPLFKRTES